MAIPHVPARPGYELTVRDLEPYAGAGYIVALAGEIHRMPGMGASPRGLDVGLRGDGSITGLG